MNEPLCAECGRKVAPDSDHIHVEGEWRKIADRNDIETYYFHPDCWMDVVDNWVSPA